MSRSKGEGGQAFLEEKGDLTLCDRYGTGNMELLCLMSNPLPSTLPCLSFPLFITVPYPCLLSFLLLLPYLPYAIP